MIRRITILLVVAVMLVGCSQTASGPSSASDRVIARAYDQHLSGVQVADTGTVIRVLPDDTNGGRHQRFILELDSGQTLLVAHNIDVAPRVPALLEGDTIEFSGVYEWNDEGGVIHWTHRDPDGVHEAGWLKHNGVLYQ